MRELTIQEAEALVGERLDRRRKYATTDDCNPDFDDVILFSIGSWSGPCSGCSPDDEYWTGTHGAGCSECGGTGRRRFSQWVPHQTKDGRFFQKKYAICLPLRHIEAMEQFLVKEERLMEVGGGENPLYFVIKDIMNSIKEDNAKNSREGN